MFVNIGVNISSFLSHVELAVSHVELAVVSQLVIFKLQSVYSDIYISVFLYHSIFITLISVQS